VSRPTTS